MIIKILVPPDIKSDTEAKTLAIENILKSHGEGKHRVWMTFESAKAIAGIEGLSQFAKRALDELISKINEEYAIDKELAFHAQVEFIDKHKISYENGILIIGYQHLTDSSATQESILLTENELDGEALAWGAKTYLHKARLGKFSVALSVQPGGGNTTYDGFIRLNKSNRFFACFVDSDKDHPLASLGDTAGRFKKIEQGFLEKRYFEILPYHEIENLIPIKILRALFTEQCDKSLVLQDQNITFRAYPDHKTGVAISTAKADDRKHGDDYWGVFETTDEEQQLCAKFGDGMLKTCVGFMDSLSPKESLTYLNDDSDAEWLRVCKIVASWAVGGRGLRS